MAITKKMQDALNEQINNEFYASYMYLSMSAYFENIGLKGCAKWMRLQSSEETKHAMKLYEHIIARNGKVVLKQLAAPNTEWKNVREAFQDALSHEMKVTQLINKLADTAASEKDNAAAVLLQWFINEQVEEEDTATEIVQKLKLIGDSAAGLYMLDQDLGSREKDD